MILDPKKDNKKNLKNKEDSTLDRLNKSIESLNKFQSNAKIESFIKCDICNTKNIYVRNGYCKNNICKADFSDKPSYEIRRLKKIYKANVSEYKHNLEQAVSLCIKCNIENKMDALFCKNCGEKLYEEEKITIRRCEKCNKVYNSNDKYCSKDGGKILKETKIIDKIPQQKIKNQDDDIGFKFGNFFNFLLIIGIIGAIMLMLSPLSKSYLMKIVLMEVIIINTFLLYGLFNRLLWAFYLIYFEIFCRIVSLTLVIAANMGDTFIARGFIGIFVYFCILSYYNKRKHLFS